MGAGGPLQGGGVPGLMPPPPWLTGTGGGGTGGRAPHTGLVDRSDRHDGIHHMRKVYAGLFSSADGLVEAGHAAAPPKSRRPGCVPGRCSCPRRPVTYVIGRPPANAIAEYHIGIWHRRSRTARLAHMAQPPLWAASGWPGLVSLSRQPP